MNKRKQKALTWLCASVCVIFGAFISILVILSANLFDHIVAAPWPIFIHWALLVIGIIVFWHSIGIAREMFNKKVQEASALGMKIEDYEATNEKSKMNEDKSIIVRLLMKFRPLRRKAMENTVREDKASDELVDTLNRSVSRHFAPIAVELVNKGKIEADCIESPAYFRICLKKIFGKKSNAYAGELRMERAKISNQKAISIYLLHTPSKSEVVQAHIVGFIHADGREYETFVMEHTFNKGFVICQWCEKNHVNYGIVDGKVDFVKKMIELHCDSELKSNSSPCEKLDLKHRLANEIGVKYENLNLYMSIFQEKVTMEMQGLDSSGLDEQITDEEEWSRYCQWEISQAKKRMSKDELEKSKELFEWMIERDKKNQT